MGMYNLRCEENSYLSEYVTKIIQSLKQLANINLVDSALIEGTQAKQAFEADYYLLAHNGTADPVFNYANQAAMDLFEMTWDEFTNLPSKYSAEADEREERERFLAEVKANGFSKNYSGIRISKTGKRFRIKDVLLWNVLDDEGNRIGQAAMFESVECL